MPCSTPSANRGLALVVLAVAMASSVDASPFVRPGGGPKVAAAPSKQPSSETEQARAGAPTDTDGGAHSGSATSSAVPPPPTESEQRARSEFERAQRAYDLGRFEEAIVHYSRAYEAMPLPPFLFNIAQCHRLLSEYAQAAFFYRRYLDLAGSPPNAPLARELLSEMEQRQKEHERLERETGARVRAALATPPPRSESFEPLYKRWWFWAAVGGTVAGITAVTVASAQPPRTTLGTLDTR
jgi:hypothetical protein